MTNTRKYGPQRPSSKPARPSVIISSRTPPLMQLTLYPTHIERRTRAGNGWISDIVAASAIAEACANTPQSSGLLPPNTIAFGRIHGEPFAVQYVPARVATLQTETTSYTFPLPPLVFGGYKKDYRIWAMDTFDQPTKTNAPLWRPPFPNCYTNGRICWGDVSVPPLTRPTQLTEVLRLFLEESKFNLHIADGKSVAYPRSVIACWENVVASEATEYPVNDLMPAGCQLAWLIDGSPWQDRENR